MATAESIKDHAAEQRLYRRRAVSLGLLMLLCLLGLGWRLLHLQYQAFDRYRTASNRNRITIEAVSPVRGLVWDRNGSLLAENRAAFSLQLTPERVPNLNATLAELARLLRLDETEIQLFRQEARRRRSFERVVLRSYLSEQEAAVFAANRHRFPGVDLQGELVRHYPYGELAAHAVGYTGRISESDQARIDRRRYQGTLFIGKSGVERAAESKLHGEVGYQQVEVDAHGRSLRVLDRNDPEPGQDLVLNLDIDLQRVASQALGERRGAVVAIDPSSGGVLALVSKPSFDPNRFVTGLNTAEYQALVSGGRPLFDRAVQGQYPPGSTLKPFFAIAALHDGKARPEERSFCSGAFQLPGRERKYRCWKRQGHGHLNLADAIKHSCDVYFYGLALNLGIQRMHDHLKAFGFGDRTGLDLSGEASGLVPSADWKRATRGEAWFPGETLISGIGQGFNLVTPLQLAVATATLANKGSLYAPRMVRDTANSGALIRKLERHPAHWQLAHQAMVAVMQSPGGTAYRSGLGAAYSFAGKTGTAQVYELAQDDEERDPLEPVEERLRDHALFIGFAPAEAPRIAVAVLVEHGGSGSAAAAPVARLVLDHYLREGSG